MFCKSIDCPLTEACARFDISEDAEKYEYEIINGNHIACDSYISKTINV